MDPRVKEIRLMQWKELIIACNTSGMTKKEWMEINHINSKTFYRMQKTIREYELDKRPLPRLSEYNACSAEGQFVDVTAIIKSPEMNRPAYITGPADRTGEQLSPEIMLQVGPYSLYIGSGITESTLRTVLEVIRNA